MVGAILLLPSLIVQIVWFIIILNTYKEEKREEYIKQREKEEYNKKISKEKADKELERQKLQIYNEAIDILKEKIEYIKNCYKKGDFSNGNASMCNKLYKEFFDYKNEAERRIISTEYVSEFSRISTQLYNEHKTSLINL